MARVMFTNTNTITVDAPADRSWVAAATGQGGAATVRLSRASRAASTQYINPEGGSLVVIQDDTSGPWRGIVESIEEVDSDLRLTVYQPQSLFGSLIVPGDRVLRNLPCALIVWYALRDTLSNIRGVHLAASRFDGGGPIISEYRLGGQDLQSVLTDMMQASGSEVVIDGDGTLSWQGPLAGARYVNTLLVAGGNFHDARRRLSNRDRVTSVTASSDDERYTARDGSAAAAGWPGQASISVDGGGAALVAAAQAELDQRSQPTIVIEGSVGPDLFSIRERDYLRVLLPWAGFTGRGHLVRVLSRERAEPGSRMPLTLQTVPQPAGTPMTAGAGGRVRPYTRVSRDGRAGSFVSQHRHVQRQVAALRRGA